MYPFQRFTERAKKVLTMAQEEAERSHHSYIGTEHLLLGLMREEEGLAAKVLADLGMEIERVRQAVEALLSRDERATIRQIIPTSRVKRVIEISFEESRRMGHDFVGTEHLLLGLMIEGEGIAAQVLNDMGLTVEAVRPAIEESAGTAGQPPTAESPQRPTRPRQPHVHLDLGTRHLQPISGSPKSTWRLLTVGSRVLRHDPDPPHTLHEGTITAREDGAEGPRLTIQMTSGGDPITSGSELLHPVPMLDSSLCFMCRALPEAAPTA